MREGNGSSQFSVISSQFLVAGKCITHINQSRCTNKFMTYEI